MAYPLRTMFLPRDWFLHFVLSMFLLDTVTMSNVCQESRNGSVAVSNICQASVNQSVTVTVTLNSHVSLNSSSVGVVCLKGDVRQFVVDKCNGVETAEARYEQFGDRVQCNITEEGGVQIIMSRLRPEDNGTYCCEPFFSDSQDRTHGSFVLYVTSGLTHEEQQDAVTTAAPNMTTSTTPQTPTVTMQPWNWVLVLVLTVLPVLGLMVLAVVWIRKHKCRKQKHEPVPTAEIALTVIAAPPQRIMGRV